MGASLVARMLASNCRKAVRGDEVGPTHTHTLTYTHTHRERLSHILTELIGAHCQEGLHGRFPRCARAGLELTKAIRGEEARHRHTHIHTERGLVFERSY